MTTTENNKPTTTKPTTIIRDVMEYRQRGSVPLGQYMGPDDIESLSPYVWVKVGEAHMHADGTIEIHLSGIHYSDVLTVR